MLLHQRQMNASNSEDGAFGGSNTAESIWKPLKHSAKAEWSWVDWLRFLFYRSDFFLRLPFKGLT